MHWWYKHSKFVFNFTNLCDFPNGPAVTTLLPLQGTWVRSLIGELISCMPHGMGKKKKKNNFTSLPSFWANVSKAIWFPLAKLIFSQSTMTSIDSYVLTFTKKLFVFNVSVSMKTQKFLLSQYVLVLYFDLPFQVQSSTSHMRKYIS